MMFSFEPKNRCEGNWDVRPRSPGSRIMVTVVKDADGNERKVRESTPSGNEGTGTIKHFDGPPGQERLVLVAEPVVTPLSNATLCLYRFFEGEPGRETQCANLCVPTNLPNPDLGIRIVREDSPGAMADALESVRADVEAGKCNEQTYTLFADTLKHHHEHYLFYRDYDASSE